MKQIVAHYERSQDYEKCIEYAERWIAADNYAEDAYRSLMTGYCSTGDKSALIRTFNRCKDNMMTGLNCTLSEQTDLLYRKLIAT
jgi:DNA-binding SARP family transcriptional activator